MEVKIIASLTDRQLDAGETPSTAPAGRRWLHVTDAMNVYDVIRYLVRDEWKEIPAAEYSADGKQYNILNLIKEVKDVYYVPHSWCGSSYCLRKQFPGINLERVKVDRTTMFALISVRWVNVKWYRTMQWAMKHLELIRFYNGNMS